MKNRNHVTKRQKRNLDEKTLFSSPNSLSSSSSFSLFDVKLISLCKKNYCCRTLKRNKKLTIDYNILHKQYFLNHLNLLFFHQLKLRILSLLSPPPLHLPFPFHLSFHPLEVSLPPSESPPQLQKLLQPSLVLDKNQFCIR